MSNIDSRAEDVIPILLLKTKSTPNDGYEEHFSSANEGTHFEPIFVPVLEHQILDEGLNTVRQLLQNKQIHREIGAKYGGLIFTSQRAVEAFAKLVEEGNGDGKWPHLQNIPLYTVGPATSRALGSIPQEPPLNIFGAETGNGHALAHYILDHYGKWYEGREILPPLLFLVGEQRRDIIPKTLMDPELQSDSRIQVDELVVYGTGVMESFEEDLIALLRDTNDRAVRWVVVFSPTGCEAMLRALGMLDPATGKTCRAQLKAHNKTYIATIGPTTRDYLRKKFAFEPDICAETPSPVGVGDGIRAFMEEQRSK